MSNTNFWPENLDEEAASDTSPKAILERAAEELGTRTGGEVQGEVHTRGTGDKLEHSFYLRSTEVDYRYFLFKVRHAIDGFPIELIHSSEGEPQEYLTQAAFEDALRELFSRASTRSVVVRLRHLAQEVGRA